MIKTLLCTLLLINTCFAQDFGALFSPDQPLAVIGVEGVASDPARSGQIISGVRVYKDDEQNLGIHAKWRRLTFKDSDARLANYDDVEAGFSYRHRLEDKRFWSFSASYGSASDQVFKSSDVTTFETTALVKLNQRWFAALNYSTNRTFAKGVPLPAVFYVHTLTRQKILIFGLPFAFIKLPMGNQFSVQYLGILPWRHSLKLTFERPRFKPYLFISQSPESFLPYGRSNKDDRFYWVRREAGLGLEGQQGRIKWDLAGGIAFAQEFYIAEDFRDKNKHDIVRPNNAAFLRIGIKFTL